MAVQAHPKTTALNYAKYHGLQAEEPIRMYRLMYCSRRLDDREIQLKRQHKIYFQISGAGHEAVLVAAGQVLRPTHDWFFAYYRDRALCLSLGLTPREMLLQGVGGKEDPSSGGQQMPSHWGKPELNIVARSSTAGMQWLHAVAAAEASIYFQQHPQALDQAQKAPLGKAVRHSPDEIVYVSGGEGMTSEGEFFEAMNAASLQRLPVLFLVEDNGWAISLPVEAQTAGGSISRLVRDYPHLHVDEVDGTDPLASYDVLRRAAEYCRARKGPALVHAHMTRPYSHSLSDDEKLYKTPEEREKEAHRDPIPKFGLFLVREGILDEHELEQLEADVDREILEATDLALAAELPPQECILQWVYSPDVDPTSSQFESEPKFTGEPKTMLEMVPATLADEMERDARILVFGDDVPHCSPPENLPQLTGN